MRSKRDAGCWVLDAGLLLSIIILVNCSGSNSDSVKFKQYYVQGEQLYTKHCSNCHQSDGTGLGLIYPPLNKSDFMDKNFEQVLCLMKHGITGEITVNGKKFVQPMPGVQSLTDLEIAEIATYIYNTWEHQRGIIDVSEANQILRNCKRE